jgi:hypothetical protein
MFGHLAASLVHRVGVVVLTVVALAAVRGNLRTREIADAGVRSRSVDGLRTSLSAIAMSALGHKQTSVTSFDHLVGVDEQRLRKLKKRSSPD